MKQQNIFFFSAIILPLVAWSCIGNATYQYTAVEYENVSQEEQKELPYKVFSYYQEYGRMIKKEIPHITLIELVDKHQKKGLESFQSLRKKWKWYAAAQAVTYLAALLGYIQCYINDDRMVRLKQNNTIKKLITPFAQMNKTLLMIGGWGIALGTALYPFYHSWDLFNIVGLETNYPTEIIDGNIVLLKKRTFSHSETRGNTVIHHYNISEPLGYMTLEEKKEQFKPVRPASKCMATTLAILGMETLGLLWISASGF